MTDEYRHPSAKRSARREQLQALADRGATEGEREAARRALAALGPDSEPPEDIDALIRKRAETILADVDGIHEAELYPAKIGRLVVWRGSKEAAERLAGFTVDIRLRMPDGSVKIARRRGAAVHDAGVIEDTDSGRWGVLYRASDLRRSRE
jgi:hypothetical protein